MKKVAYMSSKPMTQAMVDLVAKRLKMELTPVHHIDEFGDDPVKALGEWDKTCRDVATDSPALAVELRAGLTKFGITIFREENLASEGEPPVMELAGMRYYTKDGQPFDL
jgi:hypothetical protein